MRLPAGRVGSVSLGNYVGALELAEEIAGRIVGEAQVGGSEFLVQDGSAQKASHLLLFHGITREGEGVAPPGEDGPRDVAIKRSEKSQFTFVEREFDIAPAQRDAVRGFERIDGGGINTQRVQRIVELFSRLIRR